MAACNIQELLDVDPCISALDPYTLEVLITQQLCGMYNNLDSGAAVTCDIQELLTDANCLYGLPIERLKAIQAQLLCNILSLL